MKTQTAADMPVGAIFDTDGKRLVKIGEPNKVGLVPCAEIANNFVYWLRPDGEFRPIQYEGITPPLIVEPSGEIEYLGR